MLAVEVLARLAALELAVDRLLFVLLLLLMLLQQKLVSVQLQVVWLLQQRLLRFVMATLVRMVMVSHLVCGRRQRMLKMILLAFVLMVLRLQPPCLALVQRLFVWPWQLLQVRRLQS